MQIKINEFPSLEPICLAQHVQMYVVHSARTYRGAFVSAFRQINVMSFVSISFNLMNSNKRIRNNFTFSTIWNAVCVQGFSVEIIGA